MYYKKSDENFLFVELKDDQQIIEYVGPYVAFLISVEPDSNSWLILKHGDSSSVLAEYERLKEEYINAGYNDIIDSLYFVRSREWDIKELNNCISEPGYIRLLLTRHNFDLDQFICYSKNGFEAVELRKLKDKTEAIHNSKHNQFTFWGNCKLEPCASVALKTINNVSHQ